LFVIGNILDDCNLDVDIETLFQKLVGKVLLTTQRRKPKKCHPRFAKFSMQKGEGKA
jgi:hypothetical protein